MATGTQLITAEEFEMDLGDGTFELVQGEIDRDAPARSPSTA